MAGIIKKRARTWTAEGPASEPCILPQGVDGIPGFVVGFRVGWHRVFMTLEEFTAITQGITDMVTREIKPTEVERDRYQLAYHDLCRFRDQPGLAPCRGKGYCPRDPACSK